MPHKQRKPAPSRINAAAFIRRPKVVFTQRWRDKRQTFIEKLAEEEAAKNAIKIAAKAIADDKVGHIMPDGSTYAGLSPGTNKPIFTTTTTLSLRMSWHEATRYAADLGEHGHKDWRLPTLVELNAIFNGRSAIGNFKASDENEAAWYWSSTESFAGACIERQRFTDGAQSHDFKAKKHFVCFIRG